MKISGGSRGLNAWYLKVRLSKSLGWLAAWWVLSHSGVLRFIWPLLKIINFLWMLGWYFLNSGYALPYTLGKDRDYSILLSCCFSAKEVFACFSDLRIHEAIYDCFQSLPMEGCSQERCYWIWFETVCVWDDLCEISVIRHLTKVRGICVVWLFGHGTWGMLGGDWTAVCDRISNVGVSRTSKRWIQRVYADAGVIMLLVSNSGTGSWGTKLSFLSTFLATLTRINGPLNMSLVRTTFVVRGFVCNRLLLFGIHHNALWLLLWQTV